MGTARARTQPPTAIAAASSPVHGTGGATDSLADADADRGNAFVNERLGSASASASGSGSSGSPASPPADDSGAGGVAEVRARLAAYAEAAHRFGARAARCQGVERSWAAELGALGSVIAWFDGAARPDPARWDASVAAWELLAHRIDAVSHGDGPAMARAAADVVEAFGRQAAADSDARAAFLAKLDGFADTAADAAWLATTGRDAAFMSAVGAAVALTLPAATTLGAAAATAGGLTGGAAAVGSAAATWSAVAAIGGVTEGALQAGTELAVQAVDVLQAADQAGQRALTEAEGIDWSKVSAEGWSGFERGVIVGPLAAVGADLEAKLLAGPAQRLLDPVRARIRSAVVGSALEAAIAGGAAYSVVGALRNGMLAAEQGAPMAEIVRRMEIGFATGLASGAAVGGGLAAWKASGTSPPPAPASAATPATAVDVGATSVGTGVGARTAVTAGALVGTGAASASASEAPSEPGPSWLDRAAAWTNTAVQAYDGAVSATSDAIEAVAEARDLVRATSATHTGDTWALDTDLARLLPLLPAELREKLPLDQASAARARVAFDSAGDQATVSLPDLALGAARFGDVAVDGLSLGGVSLVVDGAKGLAIDLAKAAVNGSGVARVTGPSGANAAHLRVARLHAVGLRAPGGIQGRGASPWISLAEVDIAGLEADVSAAGGLANLADGPGGAAARFSVGAVRVRGLDAPNTHVDDAAVDGLAVEADPAAASATLGVRRIAATGVHADGTHLRAAELAGLRAHVDADGEAADLPSWALPFDEDAASGAVHLDHASVDGLRTAGASVGSASVDGASVTKGAGKRADAAITAARAAEVHAAGTDVASASLANLRAGSDAGGKHVRASVGQAKVGGLSSGGVKVGDAQLDRVSTDTRLASDGPHTTGAIGRASAGRIRAAGAQVGKVTAKQASFSAGGDGATASVGFLAGTDVSAAGVDADLVGLLDAKVSTGNGRHAGSVGLAHVAGVRGTGFDVGHATVIDADGALAGEHGSANVGLASAHRVSGAGGHADGISVSGVGADWQSTDGGLTVDRADAWGGAYHGDGADVTLGTASLAGVRADLASRSGSVAKAQATGIGVHTTRAASTTTGTGTGSDKDAGSAVSFDPASLAGLVREADVDASVPLTAHRYGGGFLGATVRPGTKASVSARVRAGALDPAGTGLAVAPGIEGPLGTSFDGVGLEQDGASARIRPKLGGLPDLDVTGLVPGVEDGVPLDLVALAGRVSPAKRSSEAPTHAHATDTATGARAGDSGAAGAGATAGSGTTGSSSTQSTTQPPEPSPVDLDGLSVNAAVRLGGAVDLGVASGTLADRPDRNRLTVAADGTRDVVVRFVGLLVGALRVDLPQGSGRARAVEATGGALHVADHGREVSGTVGAITLDGAEGRQNP